MKEKINPRFWWLLLLIIAVAAMRVPNAAQFTPWANFTPIGAMGLFGGAYFKSRWKAFAFPLLTLLLSDLVINNIVFGGRYGVMYSGWYILYGIFVLIVLYGRWLIQKVSVQNIALAGLVAALSHWLLADFTVWLGGGTDLRTMTPLTRDWAGLMQCYAQGYPMMKNFLAGNLVYSAILFGSFEWAQRRYPELRLSAA